MIDSKKVLFISGFSGLIFIQDLSHDVLFGWKKGDAMVISFIKISQFLLHLLSRVFTTIERFVRIIKDLRIQRIDWFLRLFQPF